MQEMLKIQSSDIARSSISQISKDLKEKDLYMLSAQGRDEFSVVF